MDGCGASRCSTRATWSRRWLSSITGTSSSSLPRTRPDGHRTEGNSAWRASLAFRQTFEARDDWDALVATLAEDFELDDRRSGVRVQATGDAALDIYRTAFALDEFRWHGVLVATKGDRLAVIRDRATFADRQAGGAEVVNLSVVESAPDGRLRRLTTFDEDDLAGALAEVDHLHAEQLAAGEEVPADESAVWLTSLAQEAALARREWDALAATLHPDYAYDERRRVMWMPAEASPDSYYRAMFALDEWHFDRTLLATRGDRLALVRQGCRFQDGATGPAESTAVAILEVAEDGRLLRETAFDVDDLDVALAELDHRAPTSAAWQVALRQETACKQRSWTDFAATLHPGFEVDDRRRTISLPAERAARLPLPDDVRP